MVLETVLVLIHVIAIANLFMAFQYVPHVCTKKKHDMLLDITYSLVWDAERIWGKDVGEVKRAQVKARLYIITSTMPILRNFVLKEDYVNSIIDEAVGRMNAYMSEHK